MAAEPEARKCVMQVSHLEKDTASPVYRRTGGALQGTEFGRNRIQRFKFIDQNINIKQCSYLLPVAP